MVLLAQGYLLWEGPERYSFHSSGIFFHGSCKGLSQWLSTCRCLEYGYVKASKQSFQGSLGCLEATGISIISHTSCGDCSHRGTVLSYPPKSCSSPSQPFYTLRGLLWTVTIEFITQAQFLGTSFISPLLLALQSKELKEGALISSEGQWHNVFPISCRKKISNLLCAEFN